MKTNEAKIALIERQLNKMIYEHRLVRYETYENYSGTRKQIERNYEKAVSFICIGNLTIEGNISERMVTDDALFFMKNGFFISGIMVNPMEKEIRYFLEEVNEYEI
jgi:alanine dehydrogenase